ncbi:MAG: ARPP-1 family domain-containing protein [Hyphomicrobiaceae bacterium]
MARLMSLSKLTLAIALGVGVVATGIGGAVRAQTAPRVAEPVAHANLAVYFLHGTSAAGPVPLTLSEAMAKGVVTVHETGNVNQLEIENGGTEDVFVQAGDIVKGGQQDRVLMVSLLLSARSGRLPIGAFCVEQGRWSARGKEDVKRFASSDKAVPSREAKLAMLAPAKPRPELEPLPGNLAPTGALNQTARLRPQALGGGSDTGIRQGEVWANVGRIQEKLSGNLKAKVAAGASASSLQLSLENDALATAKAAYVNALRDKAGDGDIVGVAIAINGRISSAEVYPSHGLFAKMWPKLLDAGATEAIGDAHEAASTVPATTVVAAFLAAADGGKANPAAPIAAGLSRQAFEGADALAVATRSADGAEIHRTYLAR